MSLWTRSKSTSSAEPALLCVLLGDGAHGVAHADRLALVGGAEGGREGAVADRPAGKLEPGSEEVEVHVAGHRRLTCEQQTPAPLALVGLGKLEVDDGAR